MTDLNNNIVKQRTFRDFVLSASLLIATTTAATEAQAQKNQPENNGNINKNKTELTYDVSVGFDNLSALVLDEKTATFYNNLQPNISASVEDDNGNKASISALELLIYDGNSVTPVLAKLMTEFSKKFKNGGELFLKVGRENTQGGDVFPNAVNYTANTKDIVNFGNSAERMVLGYKKNGSFVELGTIQDTGTGKYVILPNMKEADFWGKGHLSLLTKCGVNFELEGAARLGSHNQMGIAGIGINKNGFGAKALFERDFKNNDNKCLVRAYQNLKNGSKVIGEFVHAGKGKGCDFRLGFGKNGLQVFADYNTKNKNANIGASYTFGMNKKIAKNGK